MAVEWTTPITWTVSEKVRAAQLNAHIRDNSLYLFDPPRCAVRLTGTQTISNATDTTIEWDEFVWDSHGDMWDVGGPGVITITRDGVYGFQLSTLWDTTSAAGKRAAFLEINSVRRRGFYQVSATAVNPVEMSTYVETNLADGDSAEVVVRQLSGAALNLEALRTVLTVRWVAAAPASGE